MPVSEKIHDAFKKVAGTAIATVGEAAQKDLIFLGNALGYTEQELMDKFPILYSQVDASELDEFEHYPEALEESEIGNESEEE